MHKCLHIQWNDPDGSTLLPEDFITINISGGKYETLRTTLQRFPNTLLGSEKKRAEYYIPSKKVYYFDRCRTSFEAVLYFYQSGGILVRPPSIPLEAFEKEVLFFQLGDDVLEQLYVEEGLDGGGELPQHEVTQSQWQRYVWELFEYPDSSKFARFVSSVSMFVITVSIIIFCIETLPFFKEKIHEQHIRQLELINGTHSATDIQDTSQAQPWFALELGCCTWFAVEYVMRLYGSPCKRTFVASFSNGVDFLAIVPYFIVLAVDAGGNATPLSVLRVIRLIRVFRIFKLSRHSMSLKVLGNTLKASVRELGMLAFFLSIGVLVFSSAVFYAEYGSTSTFARWVGLDSPLGSPYSPWTITQTIISLKFGKLYISCFILFQNN